MPKLFLPLLWLIAACYTSASVGADHHSYSNPEQIRVRHIDLDLDVDFKEKRVHGHAELTFERTDDSFNSLTLDTRDLKIGAVTQLVNGNWQPAQITLGTIDPLFGRALTINLLPLANKVRVEYASAPHSTGLQWLEPEQTAGGKPFLYSQAQAIQGRSFIPLQDSPAVRVTYTAIIRVPKDLRAVMSASNDPTAELTGRFEFDMPQPIPAYLIALAVGDFKFQSLGDRTGVYAEPVILERAAYEFGQTQTMLESVEKLYGPYSWDRYDLLILPSSFPWGGMENPRLSFITPTVITGDRSLVALIAHELAHSWSGNTVTNANWEDIWLNEGFTTYLTYRIMEEVYGPRRAEMERVLGYQKLQAAIDTIPPPMTRLSVDLTGRDPDDGFNPIPYQKGALFVTEMEQSVGRPAFDQFLQAYFGHFAFQSITTDQFLAFIESTLVAQYPDKIDMARLRLWIDQPGIPPGAPKPVSDAFTRVTAQSHAWLSGQKTAEDLDTKQWSTHEWLFFLNNLPPNLRGAQMAELDTSFNLTLSGNDEIAHSWLLIAISNNYTPGWDRLESYLVRVGRRKLIVPLYQALAQSPEGMERARAIYRKAAPGYQAVARGSIAPLLK